MKNLEILDPISINEAAEIIQVSPQRVGRLIRLGRLLASFSSQWIVSRGSAVAYCDAPKGAAALAIIVDNLKAESKLKNPISVAEAVRLAKVSRQRMHVLLKTGAVVGEKRGGYWLAERDSVKSRKKKVGGRKK